MIILIIKTSFFTYTDSYSLGYKLYTLYFFHLFYKKIIRVVYAIFTIIIKIFAVQLSNLKLYMEKNTIQFKSLVQKNVTGKQMASAIFFFYLSANNFIKEYVWLRKTWAKTPLPYQDWIATIFRNKSSNK